MSKPAKGAGPESREYKLLDFAPRGYQASLEPRPYPLPAFAKGQGPEEISPAGDRTGFAPLATGEKQEDPRAVAEREARQMVAQANDQAKSIQQQAYDQGYEEGYQLGQSEGRTATEVMIKTASQNLTQALQVLDQARARVLASMEQELVALVAATTDMVLMTPGAVDKKIIQKVVSQAAAKVAKAERLKVRLHPEDLKVVQEFQPQAGDLAESLEYIDLVADPTLGRGDCVVDTTSCQVDATLATRRDRLLRLLEDTLHAGQPVDFSHLAGPTVESAPQDEAPPDPQPQPEPEPEPPSQPEAAPGEDEQ